MKYPIKTRSKLFLAPMSGVTNVAFRILCKRHGAGLCYTEFMSADALVKFKDKIDNPIFDVSEKERPVVTQIFGENTKKIIDAAKSLLGKTDIIDLNIGCPAPKIMASGGGSELLKSPEKIKEILGELNKLDIPITCKIRLGIDKENIIALKIAKIAQRAGCKAIAVHARTQKQGYSGKADWNWIKKIKQNVNIPVIGNGDITCPIDAKKMFDETLCDFVMIGRSAMQDPTIFSRTNEYLKTGILPKETSLKEKLELLKEYIDLMHEHKIYSLHLAKSALMQFSKGHIGGKLIRAKLSKIKTEEEFSKFLKEINKELLKN
jgi:tRNA-dihydrouridine synthase B